MKCPGFELLSAYADQEVSPGERAEVDSHLHHCPECRQQLAALGVVAGQLRQPRALPFQVKVQPRPKTGWWQRLRALADSPVVHLVSLQRRRRARYGAAEMARMAALFGLPMLFMCLVEDRSALTAFLIFSALGLMVGLPLRQFGEEVALLASLQRGRCLDEIVSTGTSPRGVLDGLALQGLMQIGKAALTVWPVLWLGTLGLPPQWQMTAWELELLWLPGLVALFLAGYYFAQFVQVWPGSGLKRLLVGSLVLSPALLLNLAIPDAFAAGLLNLCLVGAFTAALMIGLAARQLAIWSLSNPERPRAVPIHRRNPLVRGFSQNPIARRELGRLAGQMGGNWLRLALWRASMTVLPVAWALHAVSAPMTKWPDVFASAILVFSSLFFVRAALRTLPAVVREREQKSWEILMQTRLGKRTFVGGWLQLCLYTVFSEGLLALLALGGYALALIPSDNWLSAGLGLMLLPGSALLGAYVGLAISASSRDARQASQSLVRCCLMAVCGWLVLLGLNGGGRLLLGDASFRNEFHYTPVLGLSSLLALLPVGLALLWMGVRDLRLLNCIDLDESPLLEQGARYSPVVCSLDLASLVGLYWGVTTWNQFSNLLELTALHGASLLIAGVLIWWFLIRLPLASLAEAALGGRINLLIGIFFGFGLGQMLCLAWGAHPLHRDWINQAMVPPTLLLSSVALGAIQGVTAGGRRTITDDRVKILIGRLRWSILSVLAIVSLAWAVQLNQIPLARDVSTRNWRSPYWQQRATLESLSLRGKFRNDAASFRELESRVPDFDALPSRSPKAPAYFHEADRNRQILQVLAAKQIERGDQEAALNSLRWCLLYLDSKPSYQSEGSYFRDEDDRIYLDLETVLGQIQLKPETGRALIEQLLDESSLQNGLLEICKGHLTPFRNFQEPPALPSFYLDRERAAFALALDRAERQIQQLQVWDLAEAHQLDDIRFCPLARRQLTNEGLKASLQERARSATRREGLALLVAIKLYRQAHDGQWPSDLEHIQRSLPRPARCYLNREGSFDYKAGDLVARGENPASSMILKLGDSRPKARAR